MKKLFTFILACALLLGSTQSFVYAQDASDEASTEESDEGIDSTIKSLREKIESKVEEINKESRQIVKGTVTSITDETIDVTTPNNATFTVSLDDTITTYVKTTVDGEEEIEAEEIVEGDYILIDGPIIEDQVSANKIYRQTEYLVLQGQITDIDTPNFTVNVVTPEKDEYILDIQEETEQSIVDSVTLDISAAGFSKYKVGDSLHFVIEKTEDTESAIDAVRTLIIPQEFFVEETPSPTDDSAAEEAE